MSPKLARLLKEAPNGRLGIRKMKKDHFVETYKWKLYEYGEKSHKVITTIPLKEYYEIGLCCIENDISISKFIKSAINKHKKDIKKIAKEINKKKENQKQGKLFE